ncbi:hypothetical protein JL100_002860 [Skermanella mucosa]|uniref:hypothetical protein n=1 Tax=Skermanella mucosa TaxID=1789672 RepID=UPI00192C5506|nr:hypothetical protein [Skermanella mucosa]UEM21724.1 hypothetical protein JL100_002860 [Skermanella mucosa]
MGDWTTVQFSEVPDLPTRKAILRWAEQSITGRFLSFNTTDGLGRRKFGLEFQHPDDAASFQRRWLAGQELCEEQGCAD